MDIKVDIYEDNQNLLNSLGLLLSNSQGISLVGSYQNCLNAEKNTKENQPDVVIMDINMPGLSGVEGVSLCKKAMPDVRVLMYTINEDDKYIFDALCAGACGYLLKKTSPAELIQAIRNVENGGAPLSPSVARKVLNVFNQKSNTSSRYNLTSRELEILTLLSNGNSYKQMAGRLIISIDTVRKHLHNIYAKLHVKSGTEAVAKALRNNIIR